MERFAVIGLGRFGRRLAISLADAGAEVIAIDRDLDRVEQIKDHVTVAVCLNSTEEQALRSQGIDEVDVAVVGIGSDFEANILTTVILKQIGVARVISRATTTTRGDILSRIGADDIVNPERESADRWTDRLLAPTIIERSVLAEGYSLVQIQAPATFHDQTLAELAVGSRYKVLVVAIRRGIEETDEEGTTTTRQTVINAPGPDSLVRPGDVLLLLGADEDIKAFPTD